MTTIDIREEVAGPEWEGVSPQRQSIWRAEGFIRRHADWFIVGTLLAIGLIIRALVTRGLWLDEATSVSEARMGFLRMLSYLRQSDVHPPLYQTILWLDIRVFGQSEFAVRLPSLLIGSALIPVLYGTAKELFNRKTALIATLICTVCPVEIWYSQEARMYPIFMLLACLAIWSQVVAVRRNTPKAWIAYTVTSGLLMWTQYFTVLHIAVQQMAFLIILFKDRQSDYGKALRRNYIRSLFALALFVLPLASFPFGQFAHYGLRDTTTVQANGSVSSGAPLYTAISNISSAFIGYHSDSFMTKINSLWPIAMLVALVALGRGRSRVTMLLLGAVAFPLVVLFIIGLKRNDVFELRYFAGAVPALILLSARAVSLLARSRRVLTIACVGLVGVMGASLLDEQLAGGNGRVFDFRTVLSATNTEEQPGDLMLYEPFYLHPVVHYYAPKFTSFPLVAGLTSTTQPKRIFIVDSLVFAEKAESAQRVNEVVTRLEKDRHLVSHVQKNQIEVWEFE